MTIFFILINIWHSLFLSDKLILINLWLENVINWHNVQLNVHLFLWICSVPFSTIFIYEVDILIRSTVNVVNREITNGCSLRECPFYISCWSWQCAEEEAECFWKHFIGNPTVKMFLASTSAMTNYNMDEFRGNEFYQGKWYGGKQK